MNNEEMTESLLDTICYVIDILPTRVQEFEKFSEIEEYYLQKQELEKFTEKMVNIILKIQCYHDFEIYHGKWYRKVSPVQLAEMVRETIQSKEEFLNLLSRQDNMLLAISGQALYMSVYNPTLAAIANLSMLATAEGLFMRRAEN